MLSLLSNPESATTIGFCSENLCSNCFNIGISVCPSNVFPSNVDFYTLKFDEITKT